MRCFLRFSLLVALSGVAALAIRPFLPKIHKEALNFYKAWEVVREATKSTAISANQEEEVQTEGGSDNLSEKRARRKLAEPKVIYESPPLVLNTDPLIVEARRRAEADPEAAMVWLQSQNPGADRLRGMLEVVAMWAAYDSESTLLWLESNAQGIARLETLQSGINLWAETAPEAAAEWIDGMASDGSKLTAAKSLASKWVESDPKAAAKWVTNLPKGPTRLEAAHALTNAWLQQDPKAASIWAFQEAEFNGYYDLLNQTIHAFSRRYPEDAEALVREMASANNSSGAGVEAHIRARAEQDPANAAQWIANLTMSDPIYSEENNSALMQVWADSDSIAASEWLSQMPVGPQRDAAIAGFSKSIERFEPEAATIWANTMGDPIRRVERLEESLSNWADLRPVEALEWLKSTEMEPGLREQLMRKIRED